MAATMKKQTNKNLFKEAFPKNINETGDVSTADDSKDNEAEPTIQNPESQITDLQDTPKEPDKEEALQMPEPSPALPDAPRTDEFQIRILNPVEKETRTIRRVVLLTPSMNKKINDILKDRRLSFSELLNQFVESYIANVGNIDVKSTEKE